MAIIEMPSNQLHITQNMLDGVVELSHTAAYHKVMVQRIETVYLRDSPENKLWFEIFAHDVAAILGLPPKEVGDD